jgi:hypothetical protein
MRKFIALLLVLGTALGCSAAGSLAGGGIGGSGISSGAVSGFGSIFVTGTEWQTTGAAIRLERASGTQAELKLGMVVVVEGDRTGSGGDADTVTFDDEIEGPIGAIAVVSNDEKQLTILGQLVTIERTLTQFDASGAIVVPAFDTIAVNDIVEVSGFRRASDIQATYIEKKGVFAGGTPNVELKGTVSGVAGQSSFMLGGITVNWNNTTTLSDLPSGGPTNGDFVEVEGTLTNPTTVQATRIERERPFAGDVEDFEIEGVVSGFVSLSNFLVDGQPVNAGAAGVVFEPDNSAFVQNGARVEVEGELRNGTLIADKVKQRDGELRIHAEIAATGDINAAQRTVRLLGITVRTDSTTQFEDDLLDDPDLEIGDLVAGDFLEVRGFDDGSGNLLATEVERADGAEDVRLRGPVTAFDDNPLDGRSVTIFGVVVPTSAATEFENFPGGASDEDEFYDEVAIGDLLDAQDDEDGVETAIDVADEIAFELP